MGAAQARLIFFAFVGLTIAISYNAVFRQKGRHPAPMTVETTHSLPARKPSQTAQSSRRSHAASPGADAAASDTVKAVQRELITKGYEPGTPDGVLGVLTRAAIMAYQHDKGLPVTGAASAELLRHIVLGDYGPGGAPSNEKEIPPETIVLIKGVQQILAELGYGPGPVDGVLGAGTQRAIEAFERERRLTVKGRVSGKLLRELMRTTGTKLPTVSAG